MVPKKGSLHWHRWGVLGTLLVGLLLVGACKSGEKKLDARAERERIRAGRDQAFDGVFGAPRTGDHTTTKPDTDEGKSPPPDVKTPPKEPPRESRPRPAWVDTGRDSRYPDGACMVGYGSCHRGNQEEYAAQTTAENRATDVIARQIRTRLQSEFQSYARVVSEVTAGKSASSKDLTDVSNKITTQADIVLEGVAIADRWYDAQGDVFWALAVLNRETTGGIINDRVQRILQEVARDRRLAEDYKNEGNPFQTLRYLSRALKDSYALLNYRAQLRVISPKHAAKVPSPGDPMMTSLWRDAALAAKQLRLGVVFFSEADRNLLTSGESEAEFLKALNKLGLNARKLAVNRSKYDYGTLKDMDADELKRLFGQKVDCLVIAKTVSKYMASQKLLTVTFHFCRARGEGFVFELHEGVVIASVGFSWSPKTHTGEKDRSRAAELALIKGGTQLGEALGEEFAKELAAIR